LFSGAYHPFTLTTVLTVTDMPRSLFAGTQLLDCSFMASQIEGCQVKGKTGITLALGGEISQLGFASDALARDFAEQEG
jgi:chitinase